MRSKTNKRRQFATEVVEVVAKMTRAALPSFTSAIASRYPRSSDRQDYSSAKITRINNVDSVDSYRHEKAFLLAPLLHQESRRTSPFMTFTTDL